jgi:hypothetical protein
VLNCALYEDCFDFQEPPVTFQVGIVGTDGVLLAGDLRYTDGSSGLRAGSHSSKIHVRGSLASCASGDRWASRAAECCLNNLRSGDGAGEHMFEQCRRVLEQCELEGDKPQAPHGSILFVSRNDGKSELWFADFRTGEIPRNIQDRIWIGDVGNAAVFFLEKYAPAEPGFRIDELKLLAAHSVLMAGALNPAGVEGLELVLCRDGVGDFERIEREELAVLKERSAALDSTIARALRRDDGR